MGVVLLHVGNVTHQQVTKNADEEGEVSHQGEVDASQMDVIMHEDVDGSNSLLHTSPGELRGWYDVCILVCTPCCGGAMCVSQRLSLFLRVSSACGWEPRTHFEKSTTCLTRVYTKNAGGELETSENESSESMTASQEELSCLRVGDNPSTSRQREISSESSGRNERGEEGPKPLQPQEAAAAESRTASQEAFSCLRVCDSPSTSRQWEISSESSGRNERGEDEYAANHIDDTAWAESTVGDYSVHYSVQEASDHDEDSEVSLTTMHSRLQKLVFDHVDNEAGLVIVDFGSTDGREMKRKLVVRSIFYYLP